MLLLALDTATPAVTVALHDGAGVVAERTTVDPRRHGELLAPAVAGVLADAGADRRDLTRVLVGVGPGPFTGLRVGVAFARVLGAALGVPVDGACSLDALAVEVALDPPEPFLVTSDARRSEVYWAAYDAGRRRTSGPHVARPAGLATDGPVAGAGPRLAPDAFPRAVAPELPSAAALACGVAGGLVAVLPPEPLYLRRPDAVAPGPPKRVS